MEEIRHARLLHIEIFLSSVSRLNDHDRIGGFAAAPLCRTASGTFQDGDILLNKEGLRVVSQETTPTVRSCTILGAISVFVLLLVFCFTEIMLCSQIWFLLLKKTHLCYANL
jgi:hypothetical protein